MSAAISRQSEYSRLFVTDGSSLQIDFIRRLVNSLLGKQTIAPWRQRISVHYLSNDFCITVPLDTATVVPGCTEVLIDAPGTMVYDREELHKEFVRTAAYDLPRSAVPETSSFTMYSVSGTGTARPLRYDALSNTFSIENHSTTSFAFQPTIWSQGVLNQMQYWLSAVTGTAAPIRVSTEVVFKVASSSSSAGVVFNMYDAAFTEVLAYDTTNVNYSFQPISRASPASLTFQRRTWLRSEQGTMSRFAFAAALPVIRMPTPHSMVDSDVQTSTMSQPSPQPSLELYLQAIGYTEPASSISLAALGTTITGRDSMWDFLLGLPLSLTSFISLPSWLIDVVATEVEYGSSPFGTDVRLAKVVPVIPVSYKQINIGAFQFSLSKASLTYTLNAHREFTINLAMDLTLSVNSSPLEVHMGAYRDADGPVLLDFRAGSSSAPLTVLKALGIQPSTTSIDLPLGDHNVNLSVQLDYVGFTLTSL